VLDSSASRFCGKSKNKTNKAYKMKKVVVLSAVAAAVMMAGAANAAEIYNKDGNKLDLYGKVDGLHYFSSNHSTDG
ncbi:Outer membrane protein C, partial [Salmonella enterica subsp. enterica serovar London str. CFSAN001081]